MDPAALVPLAAANPAPWGWFEALLLATFAVHLLFMNAVVGASFITLVRLLRGAQTGLDHSAATKVPGALALTVNLGVPPLLFLQVLYGEFLYTSSILMAAWWIGIVGLIIAAYYGLYMHDFRFPENHKGRPVVLGIAVALLLATAFILTNNMTLMLDPARWTAYFDNPGGTLLNWGEPMLIPRYLHFMIAAVAVGGLFLALLGRIRARRGEPSGPADVEAGMKWFTRATLVQLVAGPVFLMSLKRETLLAFMGRDPLATGVFMVSLAAVALTLYFGFKRWVVASTVLTVLTVVLMVVNRDLVRIHYLEPYFRLSEVPVAPEYSPLVLFLGACLVGGVAAVWLVRTYLRAGKEV